MAKIKNWSVRHSDWGWRIYRTRAGMRLMATNGPVEADSAIAEEIFDAFGADPLYRKLCWTHKCYRARLTPKPWRCGIHSKPDRWPWLDANQEKHFKKWLTQYESYSFNWATCRLLEQIGNTQIHPEVQPILNLHDTRSRVETTFNLA